MKKRLEAELISIAHRILKLKNKSDIIELQKESLNLYEKLSVLRFVEENYSDKYVEIPSDIEDKLENQSTIEPEILVSTPVLEVISEENPAQESTETAIETVIETSEIKETEQVIVEDEPASQEIEQILEESTEVNSESEVIQEVKESIIEINTIEESQDEIKTLEEEIVIDTIVEDSEIIEEKHTPIQSNIFEFDTNFQEFEAQLANAKPNQTLSMFDEPEIKQTIEESEPVIAFEEKVITEQVPVYESPKVVSINDAVRKNFNIGLNDKIAFEFHLFGGQSEDFNRVLSQLNSFETFDEAKEFIVNFVKPDYNNWFAKEEFENRFLEIIESKFI